MSFESQVPTEHYFKGYDTKERWMSYWRQANNGFSQRQVNTTCGI